MRLPYRNDTPQCCCCGTLVDEDHLFSFSGRPICDPCFASQKRPLPSLEASLDVACCEPSLGRRALWVHALGVPGWMGLGAALVGGGALVCAALGVVPSLHLLPHRQEGRALLLAALLLPLSALLLSNAVRKARASFAALARGVERAPT